MGIVLDSALLIAAERGGFDLARFLATHSSQPIYLAAITASELLHGCERANDPQIRARRVRFVEGVLQDYTVLPFALYEAREHARIWAQLEVQGNIIGERDLQIAATAVSGKHSIATLNRREFERVPGLVLVDVVPFALQPRQH